MKEIDGISIDSYTINMCKIIRQILIKNPVRTVDRKVIRDYWLQVYPQHLSPKPGRNKGRLKENIGTRAKGYIRKQIKQLEILGVIERSSSSQIIIKDVNKIVYISELGSKPDEKV